MPIINTYTRNFPASGTMSFSFFNEYNVPDTTPILSNNFHVPAGDGIVYYLHSDLQDGVFDIDVKLDPSGDWYPLVSQVVNSGELTVVNFSFYQPEIRVGFTASMAPTNITAKAYAKPII